MIGAYPFRESDEIRVSVRASVTTVVTLFARVRYVDGGDDLIEIDITHSAGDRSNEIKKSPDLFEKAGWVEHLTVDTAIVTRGEFYMMVAINREPHHFPIAAGYVDIPHVPLGVFESPVSGRGKKVDNEAPSTLVNATALTRTITVPDNAQWLLYPMHVLNGDDVGRLVVVRTDNGTNDQNLHLLGITSVGAIVNAAFPPSSSEIDVLGAGMPLLLKGGDRIRITFNSGGASAGGTARSSAPVEEWILP